MITQLYVNVFLVIIELFLLVKSNAVINFSSNTGDVDRIFWIETLDRIARPLFMNFAEGKYDFSLNVTSIYEGFARACYGIAPFLGLKSGSEYEVRVRNELKQYVLQATDSIFNPSSNNYIGLRTRYRQYLVESGYFSASLVMNPWLWKSFSETTKSNILAIFDVVRKYDQHENNWVFFYLNLELFYHTIGEPS